MAMLPGWNSLEAVGSIGHSLHMAAMVVLALLVVAEGLALVYDDRKYALIGAAEREIMITHDQEELAVKRPPKTPDRAYPLVNIQEYAYAYDWEYRSG